MNVKDTAVQAFLSDNAEVVSKVEE